MKKVDLNSSYWGNTLWELETNEFQFRDNFEASCYLNPPENIKKPFPGVFKGGGGVKLGALARLTHLKLFHSYKNSLSDLLKFIDPV